MCPQDCHCEFTPPAGRPRWMKNAWLLTGCHCEERSDAAIPPTPDRRYILASQHRSPDLLVSQHRAPADPLPVSWPGLSRPPTTSRPHPSSSLSVGHRTYSDPARMKPASPPVSWPGLSRPPTTSRPHPSSFLSFRHRSAADPARMKPASPPVLWPGLTRPPTTSRPHPSSFSSVPHRSAADPPCMRPPASRLMTGLGPVTHKFTRQPRSFSSGSQRRGNPEPQCMHRNPILSGMRRNSRTPKPHA
jgi:hypothetical protein